MAGFWSKLFSNEEKPSSAKLAKDRLKVIVASEQGLGKRLSKDKIDFLIILPSLKTGTIIDTKGEYPLLSEKVYSFRYKYAATKMAKYLTRRMKRKITRAIIVEYSKSELYDKIVKGKV